MLPNIFRTSSSKKFEYLPIRSEIFSTESLEIFATFLAEELSVNENSKKCKKLLLDLKENEKKINVIYRKFIEYTDQEMKISHGAEWLIDNFHIIQEELRNIKDSMPEGYYSELPMISDGELRGYPRLFGIAIGLTSHLDSNLEISSIKSFTTAFQSVSPLYIRELWALPTIIKIILLENLTRVSGQVLECQIIKLKVDQLAEEHLQRNEKSKESLDVFLNGLSQILGLSQNRDWAIVSQLSERLHGRGPDVIPAIDYIEQYLTKKNIRIEDYVRDEHQFQTASELTISNIIKSLKLLSSSDWADFFESQSLVERCLRTDPARVYGNMDFQTRDRYRHVIEKISKKTHLSEIAVAEKVILISKERRKITMDADLGHIGYFLIGEGVGEYERILGYNPSLRERIERSLKKKPLFVYLLSVVIFSLVLITPIVFFLKSISKDPFWIVAILFLTIPLVDCAITIFNILISFLIPPNVLPKIELNQDGDPVAFAFVVIPTIINRKEEIEGIIKDLEIRYLANPEPNFCFGLLSDFSDSDIEISDYDRDIVEDLKNGISELNLTYKNNFYLFHRKRLWNSCEGKWMGWERKRGKIHEFNSFLLNKGENSFLVAPEYSEYFARFKYVITLDTDTKLPNGSAIRLLGTILHPLNKPIIDRKNNTIKSGYVILQPKIGITLESSSKSLFASVYSSSSGFDPYSTAASDTYQDLFLEGIYTGKGLYVLEEFEECLKFRVPENTLLSHDLFEGVFTKTALVSDIELLDDYPVSFESYTKRNHRWIRGDWQISGWLQRKVSNSKNEKVLNTLSLLSRWKIFDNLRRSLVAPSIFVWILLSWTILPGSAWLWTIIIFMTLGFPIYSHGILQFFKFPRKYTLKEGFKDSWENIKLLFFKFLIALLALPCESYSHLDAIFKSIYRMKFSHKKRLEWISSSMEDKIIRNGTGYNKKNFLYLFSFFSCFFFPVYWLKPESLIVYSIFVSLWLASPLILIQIGKVRLIKKYKLNKDEEILLRTISLRTWNFFEKTVDQTSNWLPPDNLQMNPNEFLAQRTSPTNIGLYLISCCSAFNFGYISKVQLLFRLTRALDSLQKLPKKFGHFFNWYDTETLFPLSPLYISTVDSGNLAGHLLAVKQMCMEYSLDGSNGKINLKGIEDHLFLIKELCDDLGEYFTKCSVFSNDDLGNCIENVFNTLNFYENLKLTNVSEFLLELEVKINQLLDYVKVLAHLNGEEKYLEIVRWIKKTQLLLEEKKISNQNSKIDLIHDFNNLADSFQSMFMEMDFSVLYDKDRKLFSIGRNIHSENNDEGHYDLLASEARLASFIAIAKGDVSRVHWFHLGRQMTSLYGLRSLISWSASMFEYLMPLIVFKDFKGTLLSQSYQSVVKQQEKYGEKLNIPWGFSESAYNQRDLSLNYQYGPFGIPGLGLMRGLSKDLVVSPYSSVLALLIDVEVGLKNFKKLIDLGLRSEYGFYEAIDYTKTRIPVGENFSIVECFMAHHQGMSFVTLDNILHNEIIRKSFHRDPLIKSHELLLQERIPQRLGIIHPRAEEVDNVKNGILESLSTMRNIKNVETDFPVVNLLANSNYSVMITAAGTGYSLCFEQMVFRWKNDQIFEQGGHHFFVQNKDEDTLDSLTFAPLFKNPLKYETLFTGHKAEFFFYGKSFETKTEVVVAVEDNVELRKITLTNLKELNIPFSIYSYLEPVLSNAETDRSHKTFNKMFIETEYIPNRNALLAKRRKKNSNEIGQFCFHLVVTKTPVLENLSFETSRDIFWGRSSHWKDAKAFDKTFEMTNSFGCVLDPIFSFKASTNLKPAKSIEILFVSGYANSEEEAFRLIDKYHDFQMFERAERMSWTQNQIELRHLSIGFNEFSTFLKIYSALIFTNLNFRPSLEILNTISSNQNTLWKYGISGDLPLCIVSIKDKRNISFIQEIMKLHIFLREKCFKFDLVIIINDSSHYRMEVFNMILDEVRLSGNQGFLNKSGGIYLLSLDNDSNEELEKLSSLANVYFESHLGSLNKQVEHLLQVKYDNVSQIATPQPKKNKNFLSLKRGKLKHFNGIGGYTEDGKEYHIFNDVLRKTPAPWINVISNPLGFGFLVSETGSSCTWSLNSSENRISPWSNDPVLDPSGEKFFLRDNDSKAYWNPICDYGEFNFSRVSKHGQGYSEFIQLGNGLVQNLLMFTSSDKELKYYILTITNLEDRKRKFSLYFFLELVLGSCREKTSQYIKTNRERNVITAENPYSPHFENRLTFLTSDRKPSSITCDRRSFWGNSKGENEPFSVVSGKELDNKVGAGLDPCIGLKFDISLLMREELKLVILLGQTEKKMFEIDLIEEQVRLKFALNEYNSVKNMWNNLLGKIQVKTPFLEIDLLMNGWLIYQTLSCRLWGRSGFYQSAGAYGFRDQLQDIISVIYFDSSIAREHILLAAKHQFPEGDVLHWWHPVIENGVRTRCSDDRLWLPYVVCLYLEFTNDFSILNEEVPFVLGPTLRDEDEDIFFHYSQSFENASLYRHCLLAIDCSLTSGSHGLPLIGTGDWNDGFNKLGCEGKGESVWLSWFLGSVLKKFISICKLNNDEDKANFYESYLKKLVSTTENEGWDGEWYIRAFDDLGRSVGSKENVEAKIDSIAQSWSVLSGLGSQNRSEKAMKSVKGYLIDEVNQLAYLFTPPFVNTILDPGYIKAYPPGVRENGGQYNHATIWAAMAFAQIGDGDTALELLNFVNPILRTQTPAQIGKYKLEPFAIAGDVAGYNAFPGKGGWSWYTGSSSLFYRCFFEDILGMKFKDGYLSVQPALLKNGLEFSLKYTFKTTQYNLNVKKGDLNKWFLDGIDLGNIRKILLEDDGKIHNLFIYSR